MNIDVSTAEVRDIAAIDAYLADKSNSSPYHHLQWSIAIKEAYGHDYSYLLAKCEYGIVGVLPLCIFRNLIGKRHICSLPYCDIGGVVADNEAAEYALLEKSLEILRIRNLPYLELRERASHIQNDNHGGTPKVSMLLQLPDAADVLMRQFGPKLRSQIKKAEKNSLTFDHANSVDSVEDFYTVFSQNMHSLGSPPHSIRWFYALLDAYKDEMLVGRVRYKEKIVAAGILLFSGRQVAIPWASTIRKYNRLAPNMLLYWNLLRLSCNRGCQCFDFGRSTFGEGTYNFKKQWGAMPATLDWKCRDNSGQLLTGSNGKGRLRSAMELAWRNMPLPIADLIGPRLRGRICL